MSGLAKIMPVWAFFFGLFIMASVGLPGLNGFVGEFLTLMGTFQDDGALGWAFAVPAALGIILAAIYLLYLLGQIVFGEVRLPVWQDDETGEVGLAPHHPHDLSKREIVVLAPLALVCLAIGLFPFPLLNSIEPAVANLTSRARSRCWWRCKPHEAADVNPRLRVSLPDADAAADLHPRLRVEGGGH